MAAGSNSNAAACNMRNLSFRSAYDSWHQRIYDADPDHEDTSSPWYQLVPEYIGEVKGLHILEVTCGRGGFATKSDSAE